MAMKVYFASDHAGFDAKNKLVEYVRDQLKCEVEDCGALVNDPQDDYPGIIAVAAKKLSKDVAAGKDSRAIVAGASGQGEAIVANRFKGVRCALYYGDPGNEQVDASGKHLDISHVDARTQQRKCALPRPSVSYSRSSQRRRHALARSTVSRGSAPRTQDYSDRSSFVICFGRKNLKSLALLQWVNRVVLTLGRPLPVYPDKQTSSESVCMSQMCQ